jgi:N-acetylglucosamine kinase-like BadF-type ATPase
MLVVVDAGSTKADWLVHDGSRPVGSYQSMGFNPLFHDAQTVLNELSSNEGLQAIRKDVREVKYFGAGCSSPDMNAVIADGLGRFFTQASITVEHDLLGSALATCGNEEGIACIIGTGSNSCWFDGKMVHEGNYGLGYVLGDEGSGSWFGKQVLREFLYHRMPEELQSDFTSTYGLDKATVVDRVYRQPHANVWLASFTRFLTAHPDHPWIQELVRNGFREFARFCICDYPRFKEVKVHFVGSLSHLFKARLDEVALEHGFTIGKVIKQPIEELMTYFLLQKER